MFRKCMLLLLILGLLTACCCCAWLMCAAGYLPAFMFWGCLILTALVLHWVSFLLPYLARFRNSNRVILKNCVYIAIMNFPAGLANLALMVAAFLALVFFPLSLVIAPGIYMVLSCYILEPVFRKYMSEDDRTREEALDEMI